MQSSALLPCGYRDLADPSISYHPGSGASPAVHRSNPPQKPAAAPGAGAAGVKALRRLGFTAVLGTLSAKTVDFPRPCPAPKGGQHPTAGQREGLTAWPPPQEGTPLQGPPTPECHLGSAAASLGRALQPSSLSTNLRSPFLPPGAPACALSAQRPVVSKSATPGLQPPAPLPEGFCRQPRWGGIFPTQGASAYPSPLLHWLGASVPPAPPGSPHPRGGAPKSHHAWRSPGSSPSA